MTQQRISSIAIPDQFTDFIRDEYPRFVEFLKAYYKFLDKETQTGRISRIKDIDSLSPGVDSPDMLLDKEFIKKYRAEFAIDIPQFQFLEDRRFILFSRALYAARGTEDALRFLFRAAFNTEITIEYPKDWLLRASDGKWYQEHFIEVNTLYGDFDPKYQLRYESKSGSPFNITAIKHIDIIPGIRTRLYFDQKPRNIDISTRVIQYDDFGTALYYGYVISVPNNVEVDDAGLHWKSGQLINISGDSEDTFLRVASTTPSGQIKALDVINFGYTHHKNQSITVSPYSYKPFTASTETSKSGSVWTVNINDAVYDYEESIQGTGEYVFHYVDPQIDQEPPVTTAVVNRTGAGPYQYVVDIIDYQTAYIEDVTGEYIPLIIDSVKDVKYIAESDALFLGVSFDTWVNSRATVSLSSGAVGSNKGYWTSEDGHISNDGIRLQDDFFYQAFSYLITSPAGYVDDTIIKINHPAGLKYFKQLGLYSDVEFDITAERTLSQDSVYLYDNLQSIVDTLNKILVKEMSDYLTAPTDNLLKTVNKAPFNDSLSVVDVTNNSTALEIYADDGYTETNYYQSITILTLT